MEKTLRLRRAWSPGSRWASARSGIRTESKHIVRRAPCSAGANLIGRHADWGPRWDCGPHSDITIAHFRRGCPTLAPSARREKTTPLGIPEAMLLPRSALNTAGLILRRFPKCAVDDWSLVASRRDSGMLAAISDERAERRFTDPVSERLLALLPAFRAVRAEGSRSGSLRHRCTASVRFDKEEAAHRSLVSILTILAPSAPRFRVPALGIRTQLSV